MTKRGNHLDQKKQRNQINKNSKENDAYWISKREKLVHKKILNKVKSCPNKDWRSPKINRIERSFKNLKHLWNDKNKERLESRLKLS